MDNQIKKEVISILVDNQANVLTRVISLFGRRGFNIDSLTVSTTNDPKLSRITVVFTGTEQALHQIISQTAKLEVVRKIFKEIVEIYRGNIVDLSKESLIIELTGHSDKIDGFMDMMSCYDIAEVCRTGITGIGRGPGWDEVDD